MSTLKNRPQPLPVPRCGRSPDHATLFSAGSRDPRRAEDSPVFARQPQHLSAGDDLARVREWVKAHSETLPTSCTLLELVLSVNKYTTSDVETVAVVTYLINSGRVRLCGSFAGAKISLSPTHVRCNRRRAPEHERGNADE